MFYDEWGQRYNPSGMPVEYREQILAAGNELQIAREAAQKQFHQEKQEAQEALQVRLKVLEEAFDRRIRDAQITYLRAWAAGLEAQRTRERT